MHKPIVRLLLAPLAALFITTLGHAQSPLKIGVTPFLSGPASVFGVPSRKACEMLLDQIAGSGARLLFVTDENADYETRSQWHFRCQTLAPGPLFNHTAVMALCHLLITRCIEIAGARGRTRLRNIETLNDALDEL